MIIINKLLRLIWVALLPIYTNADGNVRQPLTVIERLDAIQIRAQHIQHDGRIFAEDANTCCFGEHVTTIMWYT